MRVMIVANDPLSRAGLAALLSNQPGVTITGQVSGAADLAQALEIYRPDVVLWDLGWDPASVVQRLSDLRDASRSSLPLAVLLPDAIQAPGAWLAGARVLLLRDAGVEQLVSGLAGAVQGLAVLDPAIAGALVIARDITRDSAAASPVEGLTPREIDVLRLLAEGLPNKAIARRLGISEHTVKFHVNAILGKLGVDSRTEAVVRATRLGLVLL